VGFKNFREGLSMKKHCALTIAPIFTLAANIGIAAEDPVVIGNVIMPEVQSSAAFEQIKKKLGKWEGQLTQSLTGAVYDVSYEWKLIGGGSTIIETVIEDGVEMLTTYSDEEGEFVAKHYCALGTEPVLTATEISDEVVTLSFDNSRSPLREDMHDFVHSMRWTMDPNDASSMVYEYTVYQAGELSTNRAELRKQ
jgi:hypothetical protein